MIQRLVLALLCLAAARADPVPTHLDARTFERIRDAVLPTAAETAWERLGWLPTIGEAVAQASRERRPVLLWAMNGHPLGAT